MSVDRDLFLTGLFFTAAGVLTLLSQLSAAVGATPAIHGKPPAIAAALGAAQDFLFPPKGLDKN